MKQHFCVLALTVVFFGCNRQPNNAGNLLKDTLVVEERDSSENTIITQSSNRNEKTINEIDLIPADSLFSRLEFELEEITENEFDRYEHAYKINCQIDSSGFIKGYGITVSAECFEICLTSLVDNADGKIMQLPCDYDQGILGFTFSPSCNQFIIYSCYDSPNYDEYYQYRSEVIGFNVTNGNGLKTIKPSFKYYTKDWSINSLTWVSDKTIALKVYTEGMPSEGNGFHYKYFETDL